jgi:hypothetical protein
MDELDNQIRKIKIKRLKNPAERFLYETISSLNIYETDGYIYYEKIVNNNENMIYFVYNKTTKEFKCDFVKIWCVLEFKFNLISSEIDELIKKVSENYLKLKNNTTVINDGHFR